MDKIFLLELKERYVKYIMSIEEKNVGARAQNCGTRTLSFFLFLRAL